MKQLNQRKILGHMWNSMVLILKIIMLTIEFSEVHNGRTTVSTRTRALTLMELMIIIKMVDWSGASDHYMNWHTNR